METAQNGKAKGNGRFSPDELELHRKKEGLLLTRARVLQDLQAARNPRYQQMLQQALAQLENELAALENQQ